MSNSIFSALIVMLGVSLNCFAIDIPTKTPRATLHIYDKTTFDLNISNFENLTSITWKKFLTPKKFRSHCIKFPNDPLLAKSIRYIVKNITLFQYSSRGLDGNTIYIESQLSSEKTFFSIWSPPSETAFLPFELSDFYWTFSTCIDYATLPSNKWLLIGKPNLLTRFPSISSLNFSQDLAIHCVNTSLRDRLISTATELKKIEQGAAANP
jgi:hypothetical protein